MKSATLAKVLRPGAIVVVERIDAAALVIGTVVRLSATAVLVKPLGTVRRQKVALDRIRRARPLRNPSPEIVGTITRHHAAGIAVHAKDIGLE